jgi:hypothetical protein
MFIVGLSPDERFVAVRTIDGLATEPVIVGHTVCLDKFQSDEVYGVPFDSQNPGVALHGPDHLLPRVPRPGQKTAV